jgi:hypothetical protein
MKLPAIPRVHMPKAPHIPTPKAPKGPSAPKIPTGFTSHPALALKPPKGAPKERPVWLGNKTGTPHLPGANKAHRMSELETTGYPGTKGL